jgi:hypothetical protein
LTLLAQDLAVGAIVVAALGYLLWRLRLHLRTRSKGAASGCSACGDCGGCAPTRQTDSAVAHPRHHRVP